MRVVLESNRRGWCPLCMFLRNPFFGDALHLQFLPFPELAYHWAIPRLIRKDRNPHPSISLERVNHQIPGVNLHNFVAIAFRVEEQSNAALLTVLLAFAVPRVV